MRVDLRLQGLGEEPDRQRHEEHHGHALGEVAQLERAALGSVQRDVSTGDGNPARDGAEELEAHRAFEDGQHEDGPVGGLEAVLTHREYRQHERGVGDELDDPECGSDPRADRPNESQEIALIARNPAAERDDDRPGDVTTSVLGGEEADGDHDGHEDAQSLERILDRNGRA